MGPRFARLALDNTMAQRSARLALGVLICDAMHSIIPTLGSARPADIIASEQSRSDWARGDKITS
jgi:hypothetical protein